MNYDSVKTQILDIIESVGLDYSVINNNYFYYLFDDDSINSKAIEEITEFYSSWENIDKLAIIGSKLKEFGHYDMLVSLYADYISIAKIDLLSSTLSSKLTDRDELNIIYLAVTAIYFFTNNKKSET